MQCNIGGGNLQSTSSVDGHAAGNMTPSPSSIVKPVAQPDTPTSPNDPEHQPEKTDCTPENSKKSDSSPEGADGFGRLPGPVDRLAMVGHRSTMASDTVAKSLSIQEMFKTGRSVSEEPSTKTTDPLPGNNDEALVDSVRNAFAFTIDFGDGKKPIDSQRHEKMLERFQARHKRGVSLSKLESSSSTSSPSSVRQQQQGSRAPASVNLPRRNKTVAYEAGDQQQQPTQQMVMIDDATGRPVAVKLREKTQRSVGRDQSATKRHSWSPRTSMSEMGTVGRMQEAAPLKPTAARTTNTGRFAPKSATLALALEQQQVGNHERKDYSYSSSEFNGESLDSSGGIPCLEAPLENFRKAKGDGEDDDDDEVSEAGTYTIDGANYTEEQKERMNIDRVGSSQVALPPEVVDPVPVVPAVRPTDFREELEVIDLERTAGSVGNADRRTNGRTIKHEESPPQAMEHRKHNILEVSYFHEPSPPGKAIAGAGVTTERTKSKQSYIEKLKSRMKNITQKSSSTGSSRASSGSKQQHLQGVMIAPELDSPDQGTFTSVTTSGILSVKPTLLEGNPTVPVNQRRRNSLTKSHIDSSEYVQGVAKLNIHASGGCTMDGAGEMERSVTTSEPPEEELKILNCYTDSEKAHQGGTTQHRLQQSQSKKGGGGGDISPVRRKTPSDVAALTSVATKKDWIQEWAKNAREYSKSTSPKVHPHDPPTATTAYGTATGGGGPMVRSYGGECDGEASSNRRSRGNQFGYDFDIDLTKSDYYEAKKYEEFGDNLDHRQPYRGVVGRNNHTAGGSDPVVFRTQPQQHHQLTTTSPEEDPFREPALPYGMNEFARAGSRGSMRRYGHNQHPSPVTSSAASKPPMSPSKIPSPIGSIGRARSVSRNRSLQGSNSDLSGNETEMYLQKTAAAISTLQNLQRRNSLRNSSSHHSSSPLSPASRKMSPKVSPMNSLQSPIHSPGLSSNNYGEMHSPLYSPQHHHQQQRNNLHHHQLHQNIGGGVGHKRNHSLDGGVDPLTSPTSYLPNGASGGAGTGHMTRSLNTNTTSPKLDFTKRHHTRHNSFEGVMSSLPPKPVKCFQQFDQSTGAVYYGGNNGPHDVDADVDELEDLDDCPDYDEEEFEEDIDDDDDEDDMELNSRQAGGLMVDSVMPRPRAMSLEPRKRSGGVQQPLPTSTGAKQQVIATNHKNVAVNRVQKIQPQQQQQQQQQHLTSPIKRSSSFSVKPNVMKPATPTMAAKTGGLAGVNGRSVGGSRIQKSASSTSFKKMAAGLTDSGVQPQQYHHHAVQPPHHRHQLVMDPNYPDELMLYINDGDDDGLHMRGADRRQQDGFSSNSLTDEEDPVDDLDDEDLDVNGARLEKEPLTNTRYNKTFLMRMEQNKKLAGGPAIGGATAGSTKQTGGAAACPNTPELPRRAVQMRSVGGLGRDRASMPRDSSLNRMKQDLNLRKSSTGREMLLGGKGQQQQSTQSINSTSSSAVGGGGKVQPKYLDISKYKSSNAANFLKKDESKSYLLRQEGVRKSPSSASVSSAMSRTDPTRMSARSIKSASSAASKSSGSGTGTGGVTKKDPVKIAKEQELEMWRRRASYDPMKAALEGKKKQQEESRRLAAAQQQQTQLHSERQSKSCESSVLRSQSYHSGVGSAGGGRLYQDHIFRSNLLNSIQNGTVRRKTNASQKWYIALYYCGDGADINPNSSDAATQTN
ncbi:uncharacterized protein LOC125767372 [Anopheles funestus]|uniref:uncharacterized protein LOC125767372 n=1 Tax=Anopheles funestus TaxID=62324 RepID=UPI0020C6757B|nr:uncharacterized protein LOC125767372 [Anopheles funestus]